MTKIRFIGHMDIQNKMQIHWACRRGMRELDIFMMPFFEACYDELTTSQQIAFVQLLSFDDPVLFSWLMKQSAPDSAKLQEMIVLIQAHHAKQILC